jgi:hypothetical protein
MENVCKMQCNLLYLRNSHSVNASRVGFDTRTLPFRFLEDNFVFPSHSFGSRNPLQLHLTGASHCILPEAHN